MDQPITIVIPTYNEVDNLPALAAELWGLPLDLSILVVDDGSPDGTGEIAEELSERQPGRMAVMHRTGKMGLGSAYIAGFQHALGTGAAFIGQMDADFSHSPSHLSTMLEEIDSADMVLGSRYIEGGSIDERWGLGRLMLSSFGNLYARTILQMSIKDVTGGFRIWRRATLAGMPLERVRSNGYIFQVEMAYLAERLGYHLVETPIHFEDRRIGQSKMSFQIQLEAALRVWQLLVKYRGLSLGDRQK